MDPDFAVKDAADEVALGVFGHPWFVLERVRTGANKRVVGGGLFVRERYFVGGIGEQFPGTQVAVVHAVENDAHALPGGDESGDTDEPADERKHAPPASSGGEGDDEVGDEAGSDGKDAEAAGEDHTRTVAVADGPADEVGVCLSAEGVLDCGDDFAESGWVGGVLEGVKKSLLLTGREVEFAW